MSHPALRVLLLWAAGLGAAAQFAKAGVLFDPLAALYGGSGRAAVLVSVVGLAGLVLGVVAGIVVARIGLRRVLLAALVLGAALSAAEALLPPFPVLIGLRIAEGLSHLAIVVTAPVLIAEAAALRWRGLAMTLWATFFGLTFAVLALVGPPFAAAHGVGGLFLAHAAYLLGMAALLAAVLPRDAPVRGPALSAGRVLRDHAAIYRSAVVAAPATGFLFYTLQYVALLTLLPPLTGAHRAFVAAAFPLVSIGVSLSLGVWLLRRLGAVRVAQGGFALAAAGAIGLGFHGSVAPMLLAAGLGLVQGASFAAIPELNAAPAERAMAAGAVAQLGNLGTTLGTPVLAALAGPAGLGGVAGFVVVLSLAGIAAHAVQARRRAEA